MALTRTAAALLLVAATGGCAGQDPGARTPIGGEAPRDANGEPILAAIRPAAGRASEPVPTSLAPLAAKPPVSCKHLRRCD